jgi:hypothetical protein
MCVAHALLGASPAFCPARLPPPRRPQDRPVFQSQRHRAWSGCRETPRNSPPPPNQWCPETRQHSPDPNSPQVTSIHPTLVSPLRLREKHLTRCLLRPRQLRLPHRDILKTARRNYTNWLCWYKIRISVHPRPSAANPNWLCWYKTTKWHRPAPSTPVPRNHSPIACVPGPE